MRMILTHPDRSLKKPFVRSLRLRTPVVALHVLICCCFAAGRAEDAVPKAFPKGRYDPVRDHSPFAVATAEAPPVAAAPTFAANWYVSGIARIGDDNFVTIKARDLSTEFSLFSGDAPRMDGVCVASVNWSDSVGKSTVILRKGTETAKLEFNEADVHAAPQVQNKAGPQNPNAPNAPNAARTPANMNGVPRPPTAQPNPAAPMGAVAQPVHRRTQVIQPPQ